MNKLLSALFVNAGIPVGSTAVHIPTKSKCVIMRREANRSFCDFGSRANPFAWVLNSELEDTGIRGPKNAINYDTTGFVRP